MARYITFSNPVMLVTEALAQPLEEAAAQWRELGNSHARANDDLRHQSAAISGVIGDRAASAFTDMISKQYQYTQSITDSIQQIADVHQTGANLLRDAAHLVDPLLGPYIDILNWIMQRLTPGLIVREGESPVHAVCEDLRQTVRSMLHSGGSFFSDLFHLNFSAVAQDAENEFKGLERLAGDALAMIAAVEPVMAQWAARTQELIFWVINEVQRIIDGIIDWLFNVSDIANQIAILSDPNALPQEKALAAGMLVFNVVLDITMFIPGADIGSLGLKGLLKLLERFGLRELLTAAADKLVSRAVQKIADSLTEKLAADLVTSIKPGLEQVVRSIVDDWLSGRLSSAEARAAYQALIDGVKRYSADDLRTIFTRFSSDDARTIIEHNIQLADIDKLIQDSNPNFRLSDTNAVHALVGPPGTTPRIMGRGAQGADIQFVDQNGNVVLRREWKCITGGYNSFNADIRMAAKKQALYHGEVWIQVPEGTPASDWIKSFRRTRPADQLSKYAGIFMMIVDPSGTIIFEGPLVP